jgi:hypothetical protein
MSAILFQVMISSPSAYSHAGNPLLLSNMINSCKELKIADMISAGPSYVDDLQMCQREFL